MTRSRLKPLLPAVTAPLSLVQQRLWFLDRLQPGNSAYHLAWAFELRGALDQSALAGGAGRTGSPARQPAHPLPGPGRRARAGDRRGRRAGPCRSSPAEPLRWPDVPLTSLPLPFQPGHGSAGAGAARRERAGRAHPGARHPPHRGGWLVVRRAQPGAGRALRRRPAGRAGRAARACPRTTPTTPGSSGARSPAASSPGSWPTGRRSCGTRRRFSICPPTGRGRRCRPGGARGWRGRCPPNCRRRCATLAGPRAARCSWSCSAAFDLLLARYAGAEDVLVGTPIAGRPHAELEGLVGFFVNTLVLRTDLRGNPTVRELLGRVRDMTLAAYEHAEVPFELLVEALQPPRSTEPHAAVPGAVQPAQRAGCAARARGPRGPARGRSRARRRSST